jgi:hypothetical protein
MSPAILLMHVHIQNIIRWVIQYVYDQYIVTKHEASKGFEEVPLRMVYRARSKFEKRRSR